MENFYLMVFIIIIATIYFGVSVKISIAEEENYKCDTEKQAEFILKCITINPNNKDQPAIIKECKKSAAIFCTPEIITKQ